MAIEFATEAHKKCYDKVQGYLKELFGEMVRVADDRPMFMMVHGSALASMLVLPWGEDDACITVRSYVVTGAELTLELSRYLLEENSNVRVGAFGIDRDGDIFFQYAIVGVTADKEEVKTAMLLVLQTADRYDDQIQARWGGRRAVDMSK